MDRLAEMLGWLAVTVPLNKAVFVVTSSAGAVPPLQLDPTEKVVLEAPVHWIEVCAQRLGAQSKVSARKIVEARDRVAGVGRGRCGNIGAEGML